MKKICALLVVFMLAMPLAVFALEVQETVNITINGEVVDIPEDFGAVIIVDDRTLVPVRFISEYLGLAVDWNSYRQTVYITSQKDARFNFAIFIGDDDILDFSDILNPIRIPMYTPAIIHNGRTYIPIRALTQAIGFTVDWNEYTRTVHLTANQE